MFKNFFVIVLLCLAFKTEAFANACSHFKFTNPENLILNTKSLLIVTHPSTLWDGRFSSKAGMDATVAYSKEFKFQSIYLAGDDSQDTYFFADCQPSYWVQSVGGEFDFQVKANHVYSVGGHWELCQATTQRDLYLKNWKLDIHQNYRFTQVMEGIYLYGEDVRQSDPYRDLFNRFVEIVTYRNPRDSWFVTKLSLMEMMGIIKDRTLEIDFLKRHLPPYENIPQEFEVQLEVNGEFIEILRSSSLKKNPPVMTIEFIDNLYKI